MSNFSFSLDDALREQAFSVLASYGLTPDMAFRLFLQQVAQTRRVPLSFDYHTDEIPNAETLSAMSDAMEHRYVARYDTPQEAIKAMQEFADAND